MPIFYRFRDIATSWSKICVFVVFTHPSIVWSPRKGISLGPRLWKLVYSKKEPLLGLPVLKTAWSYSH